MEAFELIAKLLEKVAVLVASVLVLVLIRPAGVWLGETGSRASVRRRVFLAVLLGGLAIWGTFLGFSVGGMRFNVRMVGIIVAGYLGGTWVGLTVGLAAGVVYATGVPAEMVPYVFGASVLSGIVAGEWSKRFGTNVLSVVAGAVFIQACYHLAIGGIMAAVNLPLAASQASHVMLHAAKITANVVGVILFMGLLNLVRELERAREVAQRSRDEVRSARLEALQYQVNPHFLFNLLNTLGYLIRTDAERARDLTLELSDFLRYTLSHQDEETTLTEELEQIRRYVDLERARFGEGLTFEAAAVTDEVAAELVVPPLILQPLVENAIRHGQRDGHVDVRVDVQRDDDCVHIRVVDDGPGPPSEEQTDDLTDERRSLGLDNVRERLERFYRGRARLTLSHREDADGACAEFSVPIAFSRAPEGLAERARRRLEEVVA